MDAAVENIKQKYGIMLKNEQLIAIKALLDGKSVLAQLPTGLGRVLSLHLRHYLWIW